MTAKLLLSFLIIFFLSHTLLAQSDVVRMNQYTDGVENVAKKVLRTSDGNYLVYYDNNYGTHEYALIKYDQQLKEIWRNFIDQSVNEHVSDIIYDVIETTDGGFLICGNANSANHANSADIWIKKLDRNGSVLWDKLIGGTRQDIGYRAKPRPGGGFILIASTNSIDGDVKGKTTLDLDMWILQFDVSGNIINQKTFGGSEHEHQGFITDIETDGSFLFAITTSSVNGQVPGNNGSSDVWLCKLNNNLEVIWNKNFGGSGAESVTAISRLTGGGYALIGKSASVNGDMETPGLYTLKVNNNGIKEWVRVISPGTSDIISEVAPLSNGDLVVAGHSNSYYAAGIPSIFPTDGSEGYLIRMNTYGETVWAKRLGSSCPDLVNNVIEGYNGNLIVTGLRWFCSKDGDFTGFPTIPGESIAFVLELKNLSTIKGTVFYDNNNNGIQDAGESFLTNGKVETAKGSTKFLSSQPFGGRFLHSVDTGRFVTTFNGQGAVNPAVHLVGPKAKRTTFTLPFQTDSFSFRVVPIDLVEDLGISIRALTDTYINNSARFRITFQNQGKATIGNVAIKIKPDTLLRFQSSSKPANRLSGDTIIWQFSQFGGLGKDSVDVVFHLNSTSTSDIGKKIFLAAFAGPVTVDLDTADNTALFEGVIKGQNTAIQNRTLDFKALDSARITRTVAYQVVYNYSSNLDSVKALLRVVKDAGTAFVSASRTPVTVVGDTLTWQINSLQNGNADTVLFYLKVSDTPNIKTGSIILHKASLAFLTIDTQPLVVEKTLSQKITGFYIQPDQVTTTLAPPQGIRWTRAFGGSGYEFANDVFATADSGFVIGGASDSNDKELVVGNEYRQGVVARFDKEGHLRWAKTYGGAAPFEITSLRPGPQESMFAAGYAGNDTFMTPDAWILKLDKEGDTLWTKRIGSSSDDMATSVQPTDDGGCVFVAYVTAGDKDVRGYVAPTHLAYPTNIWLVKLDATGKIEWQKIFTDSIRGYYPKDIQKTLDDHFIIGGYANSTTAAEIKGLLIKVDKLGNLTWKKLYTISSHEQWINSILVNADSSFTITGASGEYLYEKEDTSFVGNHGHLDVWVMEVDKSGNKQWEKFFGAPKQPVSSQLAPYRSSDEGTKIITSEPGKVTIAGFVNNQGGNVTNYHGKYPKKDGWIIQLDTSGNLLWQKTVGGDGNDAFYGITTLHDGSLLAVGTTSSNNGDIFGLHGMNDILLAKLARVNFITGEVFIDRNNNGVREAGEPLMNRGMVITKNGNDSAASDVRNGRYSISADTGTYVSRYLLVDSAIFTVHPSNATSVFTEFMQVDTVNFAVAKKVDVKDLTIDLLSLSRARPGFRSYYNLLVSNKGTLPVEQVSVAFILDSKTDNFVSSIPISAQKGDTMIWNIGTLQELTSFAIDIELRVKTSNVNLGDSLHLSATVLPLEGDANAANNKAVSNQAITGSFDPNDKIETHGTNVPYSALLNNEWLTYIIRFQNTGTDTAFNVYVRDTLDTNLDWNTIEMISSSHDYDLEIHDGNKLEWRFDDILLPDSNINEKASHGFLAYRVKPRSGLKITDSIRNRAGIYFDFNLPVITNFARTGFSVAAASLPSTVLYFNGNWVGTNHVMLDWQVIAEKNVSHYVVERSTDGKIFQQVETVKAINSNRKHRYQAVDKNLLLSLYYYRLKTVDFDNKISQSRIIAVAKKTLNKTSFFVYPNPTSGKVILIFGQPAVGYGQAVITNVNGKTVYNKPMFINSDSMELPFEFSTLSAGIYFITIETKAGRFSAKIIRE